MILLCVAFIWSLTLHADDLAPVAYINQFGAAPSPGPEDPAFVRATAFMAAARPGGVLKIGANEALASVYPSSIRQGDFKPRAPNTDQYVFETLMTRDPRVESSTVYPLIAKTVRASADHCRLRVELRDDVVFSDGSPLRTADVVRSVDVMLHEFYSGAMESLIKRIYGEVVVTARDDFSFDLEFKNLAAPLCRSAAYYVLGTTPMIKPNPRPRLSEDVSMPYLGSGPYRVVSARRMRMRIERPQGGIGVPYWGQTHPLRAHVFNPDAIETHVYLDQAMERFALMRGDLSLMRDKSFTYDEWMKANANGRHPFRRLDQTADDVTAQVGAIWMNQRSAHTGNRDFRRALALIWELTRANRDFFAGRRHARATIGADAALRPRGRPSAAVTALLRAGGGDPAELRDALRSAERLEYVRLAAPKNRRQRMRLALAWLRRAGYDYTRIDGKTVLAKDGRPVRLTAIAKSDSTETRLLFLFQNELRALGIALSLRYYPDRETLVAALSDNQYDLYPGSLDVPRAFTVLNMNYLGHTLHSRSRTSLAAWGRVDSRLLDVSIEFLERQKPGTSEYAVGVDALLRSLNANVPLLLSGELDPVVTYHSPDLRLWPNRDMDLPTAYFAGGN